LEDPSFPIFLIGLAVLAFAFWFAILLPANMAAARGRSQIVWILISLVGSPILAILLLVALGEAPAQRP
jgi:fumarate reductase subunit C